jgi:hypothetical protein
VPATMAVEKGLNLVRLTLGISGALVGVFTFLTYSRTRIEKDSASYWGYNGPLTETLVKQRSYAVAGFILILLSLGVQGVEDLFLSPSLVGPMWVVIIVSLALPLAVVALVVIWAKRSVTRDLEWVLEVRRQRSVKDGEQ